MSAFTVLPEHIGAIVKFYLSGPRGYRASWRGRTPSRFDAPEMMACLADENARSVNFRYTLHEPQQAVQCGGDDLSRFADLTPVQALKAIQCLAYQSCETSDWEQTEAHALLEQIKSYAIHALPGYEEAPWAIDYGSKTQKAVEAHAAHEHAEAVRNWFPINYD